MAQVVNNSPAMQETWVQSLGWEDPWRRERLPTPVFWPGEFHGLYNPWGRKDKTRLSDFHFTQEDPKAQGDEVACPGSHGKEGTK